MALFASGVISVALHMSGVTAATTDEWKRRTVYQVVTDRFALAEGDRDTCDKAGCPYGGYCGGTWRGITEKLDYIRGMGFDAIWISPVADSTTCGYHGYWPRRANRLNHRMGTSEDLKHLVDTAHSKGMLVMFDGVLNHLGPLHDLGGAGMQEYSPFDKLEYFHGGFNLATLDGTDNDACQNFDFSKNPYNFSSGHCLTKCAPVQYFREVCWVGENDVATPDLKQEHPFVRQTLKDLWKQWLLDYKFDGFRMDAAPYMNRTFLQEMKREVLGDTYTFAEVLVIETTQYFASFQEIPDQKSLEGNTAEDIGNIYSDHIKGKVVDGIANSELFFAIRDAFVNEMGSLVKLKDTWKRANTIYPEIGALTNWVDSHDQVRFFSQSSNWDVYKNAITVAFFLPGVPIALYGAEQGVIGGPSDTAIRVPMWRNASYDETSHLYQWTRRMVAARKVMIESLSEANFDTVEHLVAVEHFMSFQRGQTIVIVTKHMTPMLTDIKVTVPTNFPADTLLCDGLSSDSDKYYCERVRSDGKLDITLSGRPRLMAPPQGAVVDPYLLSLVRGLIPFWLLPVVVMLIITITQKRLVHIVKPLTPEEIDGPSPDCLDGDGSTKVAMIASVEHIIVPTEGKTVKVVAGGLGKVAGLLCQHHPGPMISVHPCMHEHDYSFASQDGYVTVTVMGEEKTCAVLKYEREPINSGPQVTFILVDHPMFRDRKDGIYPAPNTRAGVLAFYSLWNQVVAKLIDRERPDIYHCPDYHQAMAVLYIERPIPVVVTLHNAEYQGTVESQQMGMEEFRWFGDMFNLSEDVIRSECIADGSFNMLLPVVRYCKMYQKGYGLCAVSRSYAQECFQKYSIFWGLPELRGIENSMPESERFQQAEPGEEKYWEQKLRAKEAIQREYDLDVDPEARLFVFLGRWVKQKGMDYITDVSEWMLSQYPKAQLVMIGPVGDSYGSYCRMKLQGLVDNKRFQGRLFVYAGFLSVSKDLKLAADFCLMPSRDEPFGYVDIEFAWFGAAIVGAFRGGLAKLPGFYFKVFNKDSPTHCQECLKKAISAAMTCDASVLKEMSVFARSSAFPMNEWCKELLRFYDSAFSNFVQIDSNDSDAVIVAPKENVDTGFQKPLEKPLLQDAQGEGTPTLGTLKKPAKGLGGLATIASVGNDLCALDSQPDPLAGLAIPDRLKEHSFNDGDFSDDVSVVSMETSHMYRPAQAPSGLWSRQVTPMLNAKEMSGLSLPGRDVSLTTAPEPLQPMEEFLRQEPLEDDVTGLVEAKAAIATFTRQDGKNADVLLEETLWDLELGQEESKLSRGLGSNYLGIPAIDWIISFAYVIGPLVSMALMGSVEYRSTKPFSDHRWEVQKLVTQGVFTMLWTFLASKVPAHRLMACAVFIRVFQCLVTEQIIDSSVTISGTAILCGAIQAGDIVLIYFNFMGQSVGDISKLAVRTGLTMALQSLTQWVVLPLREAHRHFLTLEAILYVTAFALCFALPFFILNAPRAYRSFSLPNFWPQFAGFFRLKVAALMGLSTIFRGLTYASSNLFMVWRSRAPRPDTFQDFCLASAFGAIAAPIMLAVLMQRSPDTAINLVKAFACFSFPAFAVHCWPVLEMTHAGTHSSGLMLTLDAFSIVAVILDVTYVMATAVALLATVGSRWRFSAYLCTIQVLTYFASASSYSIVQSVTAVDLPAEIQALMHPALLTNQIMFVGLVFCIPELACRVVAFRFLDQEMVGTLWTPRQRKVERMLAIRSRL